MIRTMIRIILPVFLLGLFAASAPGQSVKGVWKTIDDKSGDPKSHVKIYEEGDKLYGKVVKLLPSVKEKNCKKCPGEKKGKPIEGMQIMWDLEQVEKGEWDDGEILDPGSGKVYSCKLWLEDEDTLKVRGYMGISLLGRSQTWYRVN
jgi:uncharacterized protein (DUF2147 family)